VSSDETALTPPETPETASRRKSQEPETRKDPDSVATHDAKRPAREPESADASPTITRTVENRPTRETSRLERPRNGVSSFPGSAPAEQTMEEFRVTIRGQVVDGSGQGVANAQVHGQFTPTGFDRTAPDAARARLHALRSTGELGSVATTDSAGYFEAVIAPKTAQAVTSIDVTLSGVCSGYVSDGKTNVKGLNKDESRDGVSVKLTRGGSVTGKVVDMTGQPVAGVFIHATPAAGERGTPFGLTFDPRNQAKSDANGVYRFDALKDGKWTLRVNSAGHQQVSGPEAVTVEATREVTASDFVVTMRTTVKIRVVDDSGEPISGAGESTGEPVRSRGVRAPRVIAKVTYGGGKTRHVMSTVGENGEVAFLGVPDDATQMTIDVPGYKTSDPVQLSITPNQENLAGDVRLSPIQKTD
jgi:protocatechuate 3,4-dioxygenase beta subunit